MPQDQISDGGGFDVRRIEQMRVTQAALRRRMLELRAQLLPLA